MKVAAGGGGRAAGFAHATGGWRRERVAGVVRSSHSGCGVVSRRFKLPPALTGQTFSTLQHQLQVSLLLTLISLQSCRTQWPVAYSNLTQNQTSSVRLCLNCLILRDCTFCNTALNRHPVLLDVTQIHARLYVHITNNVYVRAGVQMCTRTHALSHTHTVCNTMHALCLYACMYVCMNIYIYEYIHCVHIDLQ